MIVPLLALLMTGTSIPANTCTSTYIAGTNNGSSGTSFTFSGASIGTANSLRLVAVAIYANGSSVTTISGCTIGGNAATLTTPLTSISNGPMAIAYLPVPTGTTATIVVNTTGTAARCRIEVYSIVGSISVPTLLDQKTAYTGGGTSVNNTLTVAPGASVIAAMGISGSDSVTLSWTNVSKDSENNTGSTVRDMSAAHADIASGTTLSVVAASSSSTVIGMVCASFQ